MGPYIDPILTQYHKIDNYRNYFSKSTSHQADIAQLVEQLIRNQ